MLTPLFLKRKPLPPKPPMLTSIGNFGTASGKDHPYGLSNGQLLATASTVEDKRTKVED